MSSDWPEVEARVSGSRPVTTTGATAAVAVQICEVHDIGTREVAMSSSSAQTVTETSGHAAVSCRRLLNGNFDGADKVGTLRDMRVVFLDNDAKLLFATAYEGEWDADIDDFVARILEYLDVLTRGSEGVAGDSQPGGERLPRRASDRCRSLVRRQLGCHCGRGPTVEARR
jgi:hypothetical protein